MNPLKKSSGNDHKIRLADDGELHQFLDVPASRRDAIFCEHCSAPNLPDARFCGQCGQSLVDYEGDSDSQSDDLPKPKNDHARKPKLAIYDANRYDLIERGFTTSNKLRLFVRGLGIGLFIMIIAVLLIVLSIIFSVPGADSVMILAAVPIVAPIVGNIISLNSHLVESLAVLLSIGVIAGAGLYLKRQR